MAEEISHNVDWVHTNIHIVEVKTADGQIAKGYGPSHDDARRAAEEAASAQEWVD